MKRFYLEGLKLPVMKCPKPSMNRRGTNWEVGNVKFNGVLHINNTKQLKII